MTPTQTAWAFGIETSRLFFQVDDDSEPLEKAVWHFLSWVHDGAKHDDLDRALTHVEFQLQQGRPS